MAKDGNINLRLDSEFKDRIAKAAESVHMTPSQLMRELLKVFVDHVEKAGGRVVTPLVFKEYEIREKK